MKTSTDGLGVLALPYRNIVLLDRMMLVSVEGQLTSRWTQKRKELYNGSSLDTADPQPTNLPTLRRNFAILENKRDTKE